MSEAANAFTAGFAARHAAAPELLQAALSPPPGFFARDMRERAYGRRATDQPPPHHFSPADPAHRGGQSPRDNPLHPDHPDFVDPLVAARDAGFAAGMAAAAEAAEQAQARDERLLTSLTAALREGTAFDRDAMAQHLRQTVLLLVRKLVGETGVAGEVLAQRIAAATDMLADEAESALLRLHPDDVALVEGHLPPSIFPAGDASVARGSFVLESASTIVEDGPDHWIDQLAAAIDRIPVPPLC